jgi:hypothetical protein
MNNTLKLIHRGIVGGISWPQFLEAFPFKFEEGISAIKLQRADLDIAIVGTIAISTDETEAAVNWDIDTIPTDTVLTSSLGARSKIDYIIDPQKSNPQDFDLSANPRILILESIGDSQNTDGADAWKNQDGTDFIANANDIIEWTGTEWEVVFNSAENNSSQLSIFTTNLNTGVQYKFTGTEWLLSFEGEYPHGTWRIEF